VVAALGPRLPASLCLYRRRGLTSIGRAPGSVVDGHSPVIPLSRGHAIDGSFLEGVTPEALGNFA
jgi:hypothetical protein